MKKIIAIILAVLCFTSCFGVTGYAATEDIIDNVIGGIIGDDLLGDEESEDAPLSYGIHYDMETLSMIPLMYKPSPTITFKAPVMAKVTKDTPLSVDYEFICWKHAETGEYYYPGDPIEVTGEVTLYAVFEEKQDGYPQMLRYIITGLECFKRLINKFLGVTGGIKDADSEYYEPIVPEA